MNLPEFRSAEIERYSNAVLEAQLVQRTRVAEILKDLPPEVEDITNELLRLSGGWNPVEFYTACNFLEEREQFLAAFRDGREYQPTFTYPQVEQFDVDAARTTLDALFERVKNIPDTTATARLAKQSLLYKIRDDRATCDMVEGIKTNNDVLVARGCTAKYPGMDETLLSFANETFEGLIESPPEDEASVLSEDQQEFLQRRVVTPEEQAKAFTTALKRYGILWEKEGDKGFKVVLDPKATAIDVRDKSLNGPTVFIPTVRDVPLSAMELCALIEHEISCHARQAMNGERLFKIGGGGLRKDDETLYEGLAIRHEWDFIQKYFGKVRYDMDLSTLYIFAVDIAEKGGTFTDVFRDQFERRLRLAQRGDSTIVITEQLREECMKKAWRIAYRVMRGHTDTSNKQSFAMAKDLAYLRGWLMDRELVEMKLGHLNEAAIMSADALQSLAHIELEPKDLPIKYNEHVAADQMYEYLEELNGHAATSSSAIIS